MANTKKTTNKTNKTTKTTTKNTNDKPINDLKPQIVEEAPIIEQEIVEIQPTRFTARKIKKDIPLNTEVAVFNGYHGKLIYKGKKSGEHVEWDNFGDDQIMELKELKDARASQKKFFEANWFLFDDPEIIEFLNATEYYKHSINSENYDDVFYKDVDEITEVVSQLTDGQKKSMAYRAIELINSGELDSRKTIDALRDALGFELIQE